MALNLRISIEVDGKVSEVDLSNSVLEFYWRVDEYEGKARLQGGVLEIVVERFPLRLLANPSKAMRLFKTARDFAKALSESLGIEVRVKITENLALISSKP